jgi:oligopeptide/dipeptide ABC transporter ATP-binding protein
MPSVLFDVQHLEKKYITSGGFLNKQTRLVRAVDGVDLQIYEGETLGLVGESGCGKSTLARILMRLEKPDGGCARFRDQDVYSLLPDEVKKYRRRVQMIFQDPYSSLNPRMSALNIIAEPLHIHRIGNRNENTQVAYDIMDRVGLTRDQAKRFPHEFSGGQRQRIGIARALALRPELVIADEPVSALDASIQAQILNLLCDLKNDFGLTYLFISHDLNVIRHMSDRIAVMYLGRIVELADKKNIYAHPLHPYTRVLLEAMPSLRPKEIKRKNVIRGEAAPTEERGCSFKNRCVHKMEQCEETQPLLQSYSEGGWCACHRAGVI